MLNDAHLLAADEQARQDALDVTRSFIVQAPAGSGKTELLIQRYLKLLATVGNPEEVLAITFTRKAALEMQLRVIAALRRARDGEVAAAAHQQVTLAVAGEVLERDRELDWGLIESPRRMRIQTLDAFCAGVARSLPLSSGLGGAVRTLADARIKSVYRLAAAATLDYLEHDDAIGGAVDNLLSHLDNNTALYIHYIARMLESRDQWLELVGSGLGDAADADAARLQLESNISRVVTRELQSLDAQFSAECKAGLPALLRYAAANLRSDDRCDHPIAALPELQAMPPAEPQCRSSWQAIAGLFLTTKGEWRKTIDKRDGFPAGDDGQKQAFLDLLAAVRGDDALRDRLRRVGILPDPEYSDEQWQVLLALFRLLPSAAGELRRLFSERGVSDHIEVAFAARSALGTIGQPGEMALVLDYSIRHMLVDEMQDTSIGQYRLLQQLTAGWEPGDGRTMFCVGDPMQSIYRFRDAEVGEFLLAREFGIGDVPLEPLLLRRNFRSGEELVHWFNTLFGQVFPVDDNIADGAIAYAESVPVPELAGAGDWHVHAVFGKDQGEEAQRGLAAIRACLDADPDGTVAVLVRSRAQLPLLLRTLRRASIAYRAIEIDRLTDLPEIIDLLALTRAFSHEGDRIAWLGLLRSPLVGLRWDDLLSLTMNDSDATIPELLADPARRQALSADAGTRIAGALDAIARLRIADAGRSLRDRIESAWYALGGPLLLADREQAENVYRYFDALEKIESAGSLDDVAELERSLDDERVSTHGADACRVQILTMHKAKGLQFDHVVLFGLGRMARGGSRSVLSWLNIPGDTGRGDMIISPVGPRAELDRDPLHRYIEETERGKDRLELDRLLYVACTRARRSLHVVGNVSLSTDGSELRRPDSRSLLCRLWPVIESGIEQQFAASGGTAAGVGDDDSATLVLPVLRRLDHDQRPAAPPDLPVTPASGSSPEGPDVLAVHYDWVGASARLAGTIVHRWLHRLSTGNTDPRDLPAAHPVTRTWALQLGVEPGDIDAVCKRVADALDGILQDDQGRWLLFGAGESELPVTGVRHGHIESIVIDRVRIDDDGTHWIVDYKTSSHEGGDLGGFLRQESDRHRPQLAKYAELYANLSGKSVRTALYFPLLQEFCEVTW